MPRLVNRPPSYRKHKASGQAMVTIAGRDVYLGPYGTKTSKGEYDRVIAEWLANGRQPPPAGSGVSDLTTTEVIAQFWKYAEMYYRHSDGTTTSEARTYKLSLAIVKRLYGMTPAASFGPLALEVVRNEMIAKGWARGSINTHVGRVKRMFKWAVAKELVPPSVHHALSAVAGLRAGRSAAKETVPVKPVLDSVVEATVAFLSPTVAAMVQLQRLTGCRPGEICCMRTGDIDRGGPIWLYRPSSHKTAHHGHVREIAIGPKAQAVLSPFLKMNPAAFCFSPTDAELERRQKLHAARKTPIKFGNTIGTNRKRRPMKSPGEVYDVSSYRRAIASACLITFQPPAPLGRADDESILAWKRRLSPEQLKELRAWHRQHCWHPHQLRHTAATDIRRRFGIEAAQHVLGHATVGMTELYAERNSEAAQKIAAAIG